MTQYSNQTEPRTEGVNPPESQPGAPSTYTPPSQNPQYPLPPGLPGQSSGYTASPQAQAQYYVPPQGPPSHYTYNQSQPSQDGSAHGPHAYDTPGPGPQAPPSTFSPPPLPPSSSIASRDGNGSGTMSLGSFFGSKGTPPMWQRPAPPQLPYSAFPPMCLVSNNANLTSGFPTVPPPCTMNLHPFATHDVTEEDWKCFLEDVKKAAKLSPSQRIKSHVIPFVTGVSLVTGFMATYAIERWMKNRNRRAAGDLVDNWNYYFFGPRRMEVVLCQGSERLSGKTGAAPVADPNQQRMAEGLRQRRRSSSCSSCSCSSDDDERGRMSQDRKGGKQARKAAQREQKREEKQEKKRERQEKKSRGDNKVSYQLIVTAI